MIQLVEDKHLCCGCSACYEICPRSCIKMAHDKEGFIYPEVGEGCISCKLCIKICPQKKVLEIQNVEYVKQQAYAALTKSNYVWRKSSSGGAFSEICKAFGDDRTYFFGAAWDRLLCRHIGVLGFQNIEPLQKSKYIESNVEGTYHEVKDYLSKGYKVLYSGTPCQIAGLRSYLKQIPQNLLTVDLICHGVGSPSVFKYCIKALEKQFEKKIIQYGFRQKNKCYTQDHIQMIETSDEKIFIADDRYMQLFTSQRCLRPSCGRYCKYRNRQRQGDITIGDFKGLIKVFPQFSGTKRNYSTIVFNTEKGLALKEKLTHSMYLKEVDISEIIKYNPLFDRHTWFADDRDNFFADFIENPNSAIDRWTHSAKLYTLSVRKRIYNILPFNVRHFLTKKGTR